MIRSSGAFIRQVRSLFAATLVLGLASPVFCDDLRPAATKPGSRPVRRSLVQVLNEPASLEFNSATLQTVVRTLRERHGITINVDRSGPGKMVIDQAQLVSCELVGLRLQTALDQLLSGLELDWVVVDETLLITTPARAAAMVEIRFYNVADISGDAVRNGRQYGVPGCSPAGCPPAYVPQLGALQSDVPPSVPSPPGQPVRFSSSNDLDTGDDGFGPPANPRRGSPAGPMMNSAVAKEAASIPLIELIETSILANWKEQAPFGRPIRQLGKHPHMLVIRQPQRVHREIESLLGRLRAELTKSGEQSIDGLETVAYPIGRGDDVVTQLLKAAAVSQLGNQSAEVQQQVLKLAENRPGGAGPLSEQVGDALIDLIEPDSWKKNGGPGDLRVLTGAILIRQTPGVHSLIQKALSTLSPAGGGYYQPSLGASYQFAPTAVNPLPAY